MRVGWVRTDTANIARLNATNNFTASQMISNSGSLTFATGNNTLLARFDGLFLRGTTYGNVGDIGFSITGAFRDGGGIRSIAAAHLQLSSDYSTADTDLDCHNILASNVRATYKSSDGSSGTSGTATGASTLTIKDGLVTVIA